MADGADNTQSDLARLRAEAEAGDPAAQNNLGAIYDRGLLGVAKDRAQAIQWYTKAAERNHGAAQNNLCSLYGRSLNLYNGVLPPKGTPLGPIEPIAGTRGDIQSLAAWCVKAAEKGFAQSERALGILAAKGVKTPEGVVPPDWEKAYFWLRTGRDAFSSAVAQKLTQAQRAAIDKVYDDWRKAHPVDLAGLVRPE